MNTKLQARLDVLRSELDKGNVRMNELQTEESQLRETMLRIQGAITVLQELLVDHADHAADYATDQQDTLIDLAQHRQV